VTGKEYEKRESRRLKFKSFRKRKKGVTDCSDVESEGGIRIHRRNNRHGNETREKGRKEIMI
jgi:hypothetical protein